jgi:hypothetical protein
MDSAKNEHGEHFARCVCTRRECCWGELAEKRRRMRRSGRTAQLSSSSVLGVVGALFKQMLICLPSTWKRVNVRSERWRNVSVCDKDLRDVRLDGCDSGPRNINSV